MKFRLDGNDLVIKTLFGEKRYHFNTLTEVNLYRGIYLYMDKKCILAEKDLYTCLKFQREIYNMAVKNGLIIRDKDWFDDEISVQDIHFYGIQVKERIQNIFDEYVDTQLGNEYEFTIKADESPYHVILYFDIYKNGIKVCMDDKDEVEMCSDTLPDNNKEFHLSSFELVMPEYVNTKSQEFKITKRVDYECEIEELKEQINRMKECGIVPASKFNA